MTSTPFEVASSHLHLIGWPTLCYAVYRVVRFLTALETRAARAEEQLINHIPTSLGEVKESVDNMKVALLESNKETRDVIRDTFRRL